MKTSTPCAWKDGFQPRCPCPCEAKTAPSAHWTPLPGSTDELFGFAIVLNPYQGGMCNSEVLKTAERTPHHLISHIGPNWVATDNAAGDMYISLWP